MEKQFKVVRGCINQDTGRLMKCGDTIYKLSEFEISRHLAEGNIVPLPTEKVEKAVAAPPEKRKRKYTRRKKNVTD